MISLHGAKPHLKTCYIQAKKRDISNFDACKTRKICFGVKERESMRQILLYINEDPDFERNMSF